MYDLDTGDGLPEEATRDADVAAICEEFGI